MISRAAPIETVLSACLYSTCAIGSLVFNKLAVYAFPAECTLLSIQMMFSVVCMLACFHSLHFGSFRDVVRWSLVAPFFTGTLLTSILALKHAPVSMLVVFRVLSALLALGVERFYPNPLTVNFCTVFSIIAMVVGSALYAGGSLHTWAGLPWVLANMVFAVADRLLQRIMLSSEQRPVDISLTGVTLISNAWGFLILLAVAWFSNEFAEIPPAVAALQGPQMWWILCSCVVGTSLSFTAVNVQAHISATSFLVLVNVNKFGIIFCEGFIGARRLTFIQMLGAVIALSAGMVYGQARNALYDQSVRAALLPKSAVA
mmetsp:Transcript_3014/g.8712  ORF Transcript_3014/g.8712 Transcript_3014/m.8712 type:complete len:316 (-) Transcript_3014:130-1077(-)